MKSHNYISDHSELHWHQHVILVRPCKKESNVEDNQSVKYKNDGPHELRRCENRVSFGGEKIGAKTFGAMVFGAKMFGAKTFGAIPTMSNTERAFRRWIH